MTTLINNNDAIPDATAPTNANSGGTGNTAYTDVANVGALVGYTAAPISGVASLAMPLNSSALGFVGYSSLALATCGIRMSILLPSSAPGASFGVAQIRNAAGIQAELAINNAGQLQVLDALGSNTKKSFVAFGTNNLWGTVIDVELGVIKGTTTSNGTIWAAYFLQGSSTPFEAAYNPGATVNAGTASSNDIRYGKFTSAQWSAGAGNILFDNMAYSDSNVSVGPTVSPTSSTASITLSGSASDALAFPDTAAGAVSLAGSAGDALAFPSTGAGTVSLSGTAGDVLKFPTAGAGSISLGAAAAGTAGGVGTGAVTLGATGGAVNLSLGAGTVGLSAAGGGSGIATSTASITLGATAVAGTSPVSFKIGSSPVSAIKIGGLPISRIYLGATRVI